MARMQRSLFAQLNALAEEISQSSVKAASEKSAGPVPSDPGGYQGASSHPSTSVDNSVQNATEGARASEYEADVKKQQGAVSVNNTPDLPQEGRQDDVQLNLGTNAAATGEDPAAEKDFKGTKDDPVQLSPFRVDTSKDKGYLATNAVSGTRLNTAINQAANSKDVKDRLIAFGVETSPHTPAQLAERTRVETVKWAKAIKDAGIQPE
jgi:hypothetical protein